MGELCHTLNDSVSESSAHSYEWLLSHTKRLYEWVICSLIWMTPASPVTHTYEGWYEWVMSHTKRLYEWVICSLIWTTPASPVTHISPVTQRYRGYIYTLRWESRATHSHEWTQTQICHAHIWMHDDTHLICVICPLTHMNDSGQVVSHIQTNNICRH